jgi:hypothetical protein
MQGFAGDFESGLSHFGAFSGMFAGLALNAGALPGFADSVACELVVMVGSAPPLTATGRMD